jgi:hypothetical protein
MGLTYFSNRPDLTRFASDRKLFLQHIIGKDRANGGIALLQPIQLPSGKIVDLAKCIAIVPGTSETNSEMILAGTEQQLQIDAADLKILQQKLKSDRTADRERFSGENEQLEVADKDREEIAQRLKSFNAKWEKMAADENAECEANALKQIIDAERPSGQKLYSAE